MAWNLPDEVEGGISNDVVLLRKLAHVADIFVLDLSMRVELRGYIVCTPFSFDTKELAAFEKVEEGSGPTTEVCNLGSRFNFEKLHNKAGDMCRSEELSEFEGLFFFGVAVKGRKFLELELVETATTSVILVDKRAVFRFGCLAILGSAFCCANRLLRLQVEGFGTIGYWLGCGCGWWSMTARVDGRSRVEGLAFSGFWCLGREGEEFELHGK